MFFLLAFVGFDPFQQNSLAFSVSKNKKAGILGKILVLGYFAVGSPGTIHMYKHIGLHIFDVYVLYGILFGIGWFTFYY